MQLEKIKAQVNAMSSALSELENGGSVAFFKALIQKSSIEIYEISLQLDKVNEPEKSKPNIKIISQSEILKKNTDEKTEPTIPEIIGNNEFNSLKEVEPIKIVEKEPVLEPIIEKVKEVVQEVKIPEVPEIELPEIPLQIKTPEFSVKENKIETKTLNNNKQLIDPDDDSLNAKLSKSIKPVINIAEKSKETPIKDLVKSISISKKFEFIKVLFDGNSDAYKNTLNVAQNAGSYEEALQYLQNNVTGQFDWTSEESEELAKEFYSLLRRRHM